MILTIFVLVVIFASAAFMIHMMVSVAAENISDKYQIKTIVALDSALIGVVWIALIVLAVHVYNTDRIIKIRHQMLESRAKAVKKCMAEVYQQSHVAFAVWEDKTGRRWIAENDDSFGACKYAQ